MPSCLAPWSGTCLPPPGVSWRPRFRAAEEPAEGARSIPEMWLVVVGMLGGWQASRLRLVAPREGAERAPGTTATSPPKRQSPTPSRKHTCPVEHMHAHPRASTYPHTGGEETEDPCGTPCGFPSVSLSHLYRLVCKRDSGQAPGGLLGLRGKGALGKLSLPPSLPPADGQSWAHGVEATDESAGLRRGRLERGGPEGSYFVLVSLHPSGTLTSFFSLPSPGLMSVPDKGTVLLSSPPHPLHQIAPKHRDPKAGASGFRSKTRRPSLGQQV